MLLLQWKISEYAKWLDPDRVPCYVRDDEEDTDGL
jgi:hypothetical protein